MPGLHNSTTRGLYSTDSPPSTYCAPLGVLKEAPSSTSGHGPDGVTTGSVGEEAQGGSEIASVCDQTGCDSGKLP